MCRGRSRVPGRREPGGRRPSPPPPAAGDRPAATRQLWLPRRPTPGWSPDCLVGASGGGAPGGDSHPGNLRPALPRRRPRQRSRQPCVRPPARADRLGSAGFLVKGVLPVPPAVLLHLDPLTIVL